jgi:hypothetical protein
MNRPIVVLGVLFVGAIALRFALARGPAATPPADPAAPPTSSSAPDEPVAGERADSIDEVAVEFPMGERVVLEGRLIWCGTGLGEGEDSGPVLDVSDLDRVVTHWEGGTIRVMLRDLEWDRLLQSLKALDQDAGARASAISRFLASRIPVARVRDVADRVHELADLERDPTLRYRLVHVAMALRAGAPWKAAFDADPAQDASPVSAPAGR